MPQVVQAKCPHCHNVLRIPAEWLAMPMRCKFCKKAFQAQSKSSASASANAMGVMAAPAAKTNVPVGKPANAVKQGIPTATLAPPPARGSFSFDDNAAAAPIIKTRLRSRGKFLTLLFFFFLFGLAGTAAALVGYDLYKEAMSHLPSNEGKHVAKNEERSKPQGENKIVPKGEPETPLKKKEEDTPKKLPPVVDDPPKKKEEKKIVTLPPPPVEKKKDIKPPPKEVKKDPTPPPFSTDAFPRRALLISVNSYLMYSTVHYGSGQAPGKGVVYPGSSTAVLRDRLTRPPMNFPASQIVELSDGAAKAHPTQKSVIETTIQEFLEASRDQDRVLVLIAGHGTVLDKKAYLVPSDGNAAEEKTLIPLKWVYDQLAKCKAQQKLLVLDTFRYSPSRGAELPSPGEGEEGKMPEEFDMELLNPPAGVQVWCACVKDQSAIELDSGSAFLQALCFALQKSQEEATGPVPPTEPFPLEKLVPKVNERLQSLLTPAKRIQTARLTGKEPDGPAKFDPKVPLPPQYVLKMPEVPGGAIADFALVNDILDELRELPAVRESRLGDLSRLKRENLPVFPAQTLAPFKIDGKDNLFALYKSYKADSEKFAKDFPLRAAYFETVEKLKDSNQLKMREVLAGPVNPKVKTAFILEQSDPGQSIFRLEGALTNMKEAIEKREDEMSKRWQANFDYAHARLLSRLIYLYEYNFIMGQIRADTLPELGPGQNGWRIGSSSEISVKERKVKDYQKELKKVWARIQKQYPDTPWALLGQRESRVSLGLQWRPKSD